MSRYQLPAVSSETQAAIKALMAHFDDCLLCSNKRACPAGEQLAYTAHVRRELETRQ
jgi:hypothetical protein